jgi:hypothetical protein
LSSPTRRPRRLSRPVSARPSEGADRERRR